MDGGGSVLETGTRPPIDMPNVALTLKRGRLLADVTGSIKVDIFVDSFANHPPVDADSICAGHELEISGAIKDEDQTLTGWETTLAARAVMRVNIDSVSTITQCTVTLEADPT
jgi:hypothetical protein